MNTNLTLTSEEKVWAALAHGSALFSFFGPLVAAVVWFSQRKRSPFARFHALQAMVYQVLAFWAWTILIPILMIVLFVLLIVLVPLSSTDDRMALLFGAGFPFVIWGVIIGVFGLYILLGLVGAVAVLSGHDFRYPLIGGWLAQHLEYSLQPEAAISEEKEDFVAASVCHATCILTLWGLITPLVLWITQKDRSPFLRFQTLQATLYQAIATVAYFAWTAVYMLLSFGMMGLQVFGNPQPYSNGGSGGDPIAFVFFLIPILCLVGVIFIAAPLYQLFGFIASLRVLHGRDYHYPILGPMLARRMGSQPATIQAVAK